MSITMSKLIVVSVVALSLIIAGLFVGNAGKKSIENAQTKRAAVYAQIQ